MSSLSRRRHPTAGRPGHHSFNEPDEVIETDLVRSEMVELGGMTVSHDLHQPGWHWSVHLGPSADGEWCEARHLGVVLAGRFGVRMKDGAEWILGPLDLIDIPPGHDGWVEGDEVLETIAWSGARSWLSPLGFVSDRVLATILFTDIVDSTRIAHRMGQSAWNDLLGGFEAVTRDTLARYRGQEVKMTGDGVLATFDGAGRAVRCAVALRAAAVSAGISIRAAVHSGEIAIAGDDIRGLAVHEASRMLGLAAADEILVSAATAGLVVDSAFRLEDRGEHELRGMEGKRRLYAVP
ncbi:hypothetical protein BH23CHL8_BH23CHL8_13290 [soil metagenome]